MIALKSAITQRVPLECRVGPLNKAISCAPHLEPVRWNDGLEPQRHTKMPATI